MTRPRLVSLALLAAASPVSADLVADQTPFHSHRGIYISRFNYSNASQIQTAFARSAEMGITDVYFQVRGAADAFYNLTDDVEVRAPGVSASYDPLAIAIQEGKSRGIRVHAWINTMPLWLGSTPSGNPQHLMNTQPDWWIRDAANNPAPLGSGYVTVNPTWPQVHDHIANVARTIVRNYDVDGFHLDYIRNYWNSSGANTVPVFPADPVTVSLFQQQFPGQTPNSNPADFKQWMADRITSLVSDIRQTVKSQRPDVQLTASVWRDASIGLNDYSQHWSRWVDESLLDGTLPMIYFENSSTFNTNVTSAVNLRGNSGIMPALGTYLQDDPGTAYNNVTNQLNWAKSQGTNGFTLFDYGSFYNGSAAQTAARQAVIDFIAANSSAAPAISLADFETGNGTFNRSITFSGSNQNVASGSVARVQGNAATGDWSQDLTINKNPAAASFLMRYVSGDGNPANNVEGASIGTIGFWLRTTTPDIQVSIGLDDPSTGDRGYFQNVTDDGAWHFYQWHLNDVSQWLAWAGVGGDGKIASRFTVDSLHFVGTQNANVVSFDGLVHQPAAVAPDQWSRNGPGDWMNSANWTGGVPDALDADALLARKMESSNTVTLDQPVTLGSLTINNSASYTLAGAGRINFDVSSGHAVLSLVNRGSHIINLDLVAGDDLRVWIDRGSSLVFGVDGSIDLVTSKLVVDSGATSLLSLVSDWKSQDVLFSSSDTLATTLVVLDNAVAQLTDFGSIDVGPGSILAALALNGDTDFDGLVGFGDLLTLAQNYGGTGIWTRGDFTGEGNIDFNDLLALAQNYGQSLLSGGATTDTARFESDWALARSMVPEPATLSVLAVASIMLRRSR
jgi:uncharacterized lipoprotein YddW (UPF0748 family)